MTNILIHHPEITKEDVDLEKRVTSSFSELDEVFAFLNTWIGRLWAQQGPFEDEEWVYAAFPSEYSEDGLAHFCSFTREQRCDSDDEYDYYIDHPMYLDRFGAITGEVDAYSLDDLALLYKADKKGLDSFHDFCDQFTQVWRFNPKTDLRDFVERGTYGTGFKEY